MSELFRRKMKKEEKKKVFVDLENYKTPMYTQSDAGIKVVEVSSYKDLRPLIDMAYRGNVLLLDFSRFADGDTLKKEMAKRMYEVSKDIGGTFSEISDRLMIMSPSGLRVDKCRITHKGE